MRFTARLLSMTGEVAVTLAVGHRLRGKIGWYNVLEQFTKDRDVWKAMCATLSFIHALKCVLLTRR
jgi:hypothetical protein